MVQKLKIESKIIKFFRFWSSHFKIFFTNWKISKESAKIQNYYLRIIKEFVLLLLLFRSFLDHWKIVLSFFQLVLKSFYFSKDNQKLSFSGYHSVALMLSKNFQIQIGFSLIFHIKYIRIQNYPLRMWVTKTFWFWLVTQKFVISVVINERTVKQLFLSLL